jgi:transposase
MIRKKSLADLQPWLECARTSLVASFANGVMKDQAAVAAAITSVNRAGFSGGCFG